MGSHQGAFYPHRPNLFAPTSLSHPDFCLPVNVDLQEDDATRIKPCTEDVVGRGGGHITVSKRGSVRLLDLKTTWNGFLSPS